MRRRTIIAALNAAKGAANGEVQAQPQADSVQKQALLAKREARQAKRETVRKLVAPSQDNGHI